MQEAMRRLLAHLLANVAIGTRIPGSIDAAIQTVARSAITRRSHSRLGQGQKNNVDHRIQVADLSNIPQDIPVGIIYAASSLECGMIGQNQRGNLPSWMDLLSDSDAVVVWAGATAVRVDSVESSEHGVCGDCGDDCGGWIAGEVVTMSPAMMTMKQGVFKSAKNDGRKKKDQCVKATWKI